MDQTAMKSSVRRAGWSEKENNLLWETADEAQQQGLPLKQVFEKIAVQTGRRPNSIRNYYYAQVRQREGNHAPTARFVPFAEQEVTALVEQVLRARAKGKSVRSCLQEMANGDHSLMLRYQNKYRSVLKNRPELIEQIIGQLKEEGIECPPPEVRSQVRGTLTEACERLETTAHSVSDGELIRVCDVLTRLMLSGRSTEGHAVQMDRMNVRLDLTRMALGERIRSLNQLCEAVNGLTTYLKEYLIQEENARRDGLNDFCTRLTEQIGFVESCVTEAQQA